MDKRSDHLKADASALSSPAQRGLLRIEGRIDFLTDHLPNHPVRMLDVGCAGGYIAVLAKKLGHDVRGIEINRAMADQARKLDIDVLEADVEQPLPLDDGTFDVVHAFEIIEHLYDTEGFLREVSRLLTPGGLLLMSTPNLNSYDNRLRVLMGQSLPMWGASLADRHGGHIRVFNESSAIDLLQRSGFHVVEARGGGNGDGKVVPRILRGRPSWSKLIFFAARKVVK